jgi:type I restriction enzyme S subunit
MSGRWPRVPLGEVLSRFSDYVTALEPRVYPRISVRLFGRGAVADGPSDGSMVKMQKHQLARAGQIIVSEIWAKKGAIGIVPPECEGALVTSHFFLFDIVDRDLDSGWMRWLIRANFFEAQLSAQARGTTGYASVRPHQFLAATIPLPPLDEQRRIVARLDAVEQRIAERRRAAEAMGAELTQLLAAAFRRITAGAPRARMGDVAPLVRRAVTVDLEGAYPELGIRSFGKGTFHKPALSGADVGSKRLFVVHVGDLLFSNVFAWEGAVAVAQAADHGRFGSHRFITRVVDPDRASPEFLCFWFLTREGLQKLGEASPGGAGRNRTLGLDALDRIEVPLPSLAAQQWFDSLQQKARAARAAQAAAERDLDQLLPALLAEAFGSG